MNSFLFFFILISSNTNILFVNSSEKLEDFVNDIFDSDFDDELQRLETVNTPLFFEQRFDHDNPNFGTWKQRYFIDNRFHKNNKIVFLFIGGENPLTPISMENSQWLEYARKYNALIFYLEHRFYGKSFPTKTNCDKYNNVCFENTDVKKLGYLRSQTALQDIQHFIKMMKVQKNLTDAKWIAFGSSYSGSLAAWMRLIYPKLIHGAVSSSAPLLAKLNFKESMLVTRKSVKNTSEKCFQEISHVFRSIRRNLVTTNGRKILMKELDLCPNMFERETALEDVTYMLNTIFNSLSNFVQSNTIDPETRKSSMDSFCDILSSSNGTHLTRLRDALGKKDKCHFYKYNDLLNNFRNVSVKSKYINPRSWLYQQCTEFGFFITTELVKDWFGGNYIPLDYYIRLCGDVFGPSYYDVSVLKKNIKLTNDFYGGLSIVNKVTNVVFVHGSLDPWHKLGVTYSNNSEAPAIFIEGGTHGLDLDPSFPTDSPQLKAARVKISKLIGKWLSI